MTLPQILTPPTTLVYICGFWGTLNWETILFMRAAKSLGTHLIVGVIGEDPKDPQSKRGELVGELRSVDDVMFIDDWDPSKNLALLKDRGVPILVARALNQNNIDWTYAEKNFEVRDLWMKI